MSFRYILFIAEDFDFSPDETVYYAFSTVDVCSFHDDDVLYLGVTNCGLVADNGEALIDVRK